MPTAVYLNKDGYMDDVPDPTDWQLFEVPGEVSLEVLDPPRIRIRLPSLQDYGKSFGSDDEDSEVEVTIPPHSKPPKPPTRPPLKPISKPISTNARSSHSRKAKTNKRPVVDLDLDMDEENQGVVVKLTKRRASNILQKQDKFQGEKDKAHAKDNEEKKKTNNITKGVDAYSPQPPYNPPPPLPNGSYNSWVNFLDNGGYKLTLDQRCTVKRFVKSKRDNPVSVAEGLKFHRLILSMRSKLSTSARDAWDLVLPPKSYPNFDFCCLFLMIATPAVTDDSIILVFGPLFRDYHVTPGWVLEEGESGIADRLRALGRQTMTARYIYSAAQNWTGLPRDYRELSSFLGVGPKISLVCIAVCYGDEQGAPCDVHMVRIFKALGWMAVEHDVDESLVKLETERDKKGKTDIEYEVARACIEGWFPKIAWGELNQTWAGLGQLLNKKEERKKIAEFVDAESMSWTGNWRETDRKSMSKILKAY
jgi:endonuclease III